jgi:hypothetical protein
MVRWMAAAVMLAGCDRTYMSCYGENEEAEGVVDTSGEVPWFDWEHGTAYAISVLESDGDDGRRMWHVQCGGDNLENNETLEEQVCIETPIAYGDEVDSEYVDSVAMIRARPLTSGASYVVWLSTMIEADGPEPEREGPGWLEFLDWESERDDPGCGTAFSAKVEFVAP